MLLNFLYDKKFQLSLKKNKLGKSDQPINFYTAKKVFPRQHRLIGCAFIKIKYFKISVLEHEALTRTRKNIARQFLKYSVQVWHIKLYDLHKKSYSFVAYLTFLHLKDFVCNSILLFKSFWRYQNQNYESFSRAFASSGFLVDQLCTR